MLCCRFYRKLNYPNMKKATLLKYLLVLAVLVSGINATAQSRVAFELTTGINSTQSLGLLKQSPFKSHSVFLPKDLNAGMGFDIGADILLRVKANYFKTGIHINNWSSEIAIANEYYKTPRHQSGEIKINRFSVPLLFVITAKNVNSKLKINHEFGFIFDQNLRTGNKYFDVLYYENYFYDDSDMYLSQPEHVAAETAIRFQYGVNCEIGNNVIVGLNTRFGVAETLVMPEMMIGCGLGLISGGSYEHYFDPRFETFDVFELGMSVAYRFSFDK